MSDLLPRAFALRIYFQQSHWCIVFQLTRFMKWDQLTLCWKMPSFISLCREICLCSLLKYWYRQAAPLVYITKKSMQASWQFPSTKRCDSTAWVPLNFQGCLGFFTNLLFCSSSIAGTDLIALKFRKCGEIHISKRTEPENHLQQVWKNLNASLSHFCDLYRFYLQTPVTVELKYLQKLRNKLNWIKTQYINSRQTSAHEF